MERINLAAKLRAELGKEAVKKLRCQGVTPAVVYKGSHSQNIKVNARDLVHVLHTKAGENVIINLQLQADLDSAVKPQTKHKRPRTVIIKEIQHHPVKDEILHVDFNEISLTEALTVKVPVAVKGEPQGIKEGGVLEHILWELEIECLPTDIPENIPVDVSALNIGDALLVKDLKIPEGVKVLTDAGAAVVTFAMPEVVEETPAEEGEVQEPEVIMEKKPKDEEEAQAEAEAQKPPEKSEQEK